MKIIDFVDLLADKFADTIAASFRNISIDTEVVGDRGDGLIGGDSAFVDVQLAEHAVERTNLEGDGSFHWGGGSNAKGDLFLSNNVRHGWSVKILFGELDVQVAMGEGAEGRCTTSARPHVRCHVKLRHRQGAKRGWEQGRQEQQ